KERERNYDNGARVEFNEDRTVKQTRERNGPDGKPGSVRAFDYVKAPDGSSVVSKVTLTEPGKQPRVEASLFQDPETKQVQLRELKPGASADSTKASDFGGAVRYLGDNTLKQVFNSDSR